MSWPKLQYGDVEGTEDWRVVRKAQKDAIYALRRTREDACKAVLNELIDDAADLIESGPYRFKDLLDDWLDKGCERFGDESAPEMRGRGRNWVRRQLRSRGYSVKTMASGQMIVKS